jgi:hypothetical protein
LHSGPFWERHAQNVVVRVIAQRNGFLFQSIPAVMAARKETHIGGYLVGKTKQVKNPMKNA